MFQKTIIFSLVLLAALFQISVLPNFFSERQLPELMFVLVVFWTIRRGFEESLERTVLAGVIADIAGSPILGLQVVSLVMVSFLISFLSKRYLVLQKFWRGLGTMLFLSLGLFIYLLINVSLGKTYIHLRHSTNLDFTLAMDYALVLKTIFSIGFFIILYVPLKRIETLLAAYNQRILNQNKVFQRR